MYDSIKPKPMLGEILPGFTFATLFLFSYFSANPCQFDWIISQGATVTIATSGLVLIVSWIIGTLFDALRNLLVETAFDKWKEKLNWDFFFNGPRERVDLLEEYYYAYYKFDINFVIATFFFIVMELSLGNWRWGLGIIIPLPLWVNIILFLAAMVFYCDARDLREEIKPLLDDEKNLPHKDVYVRLKPSPIHGVGVFAIRDITEGTNIFSNDECEMVWIDEDDIRNISPELKELYDDFCVFKNGKLGCPKNFNMLTVGWYLNESKDSPNVRCTDNYDFITLRNIKKGEEITIDYSKYSEYPNS